MRPSIHPYRLALAIVPILAAAALYWYFQPHPASEAPTPPQFPKAFFLDEDTGQEQTLTTADVPPLLAPSGKPSLVKAVFVSNDTGSTRKLAYLLKYSPAAKAALETLAKQPAMAVPPALAAAKEPPLVRSPASPQWFPADSDQGRQIMSYNPYGPPADQPPIIDPH